MLRWRPDLPGEKRRERRDWVFLFESSADRDPLLARAQIDIVKTILENAEHDDTFAIVTAGTHAAAWKPEPRPATPENVQKALEFLEQTHLVGALDLERGAGRGRAAVQGREERPPGPRRLRHAGPRPPRHRRAGEAAARGHALRRRRRRQAVAADLMKSAAARTGGYFTQINPDEQIAWRAFDLLATLNAPRMLNVRVADGDGELP